AGRGGLVSKARRTRPAPDRGGGNQAHKRACRCLPAPLAGAQLPAAGGAVRRESHRQRSPGPVGAGRMIARGRLIASVAAWGVLAFPAAAFAAPAADATSEAVRIAVVLAVLAIIPAILISMTSFVRIVIVLAMVRHAFGMPQTPPNAVLTSLALFMTAFVMAPTFTAIN